MLRILCINIYLFACLFVERKEKEELKINFRLLFMFSSSKNYLLFSCFSTRWSLKTRAVRFNESFLIFQTNALFARFHLIRNCFVSFSHATTTTTATIPKSATLSASAVSKHFERYFFAATISF